MAVISSFLLVSALLTGPSPTLAHCAVGTHTTLDVEILERPKVPRHDESIGNDRLVLRGPDGKTLFSQDTKDGHWVCLGFDRAKGRYLVGGYAEQGTWLVVGPVLYLPEDGAGKRFEESAFSRKEYMAMASLTSPSGRYVAFVGGIGVIDGLYVLDTEADQIRRLGKAPAPPPLGADDDFACDDGFDWGSCWAGAYGPLEPDVLRWEGDDVLVVTRGHDTPKRRSKKRTTQRYKL